MSLVIELLFETFSNLKVLVVEDNVEVASFIRYLLESKHITKIEVATNVSDAQNLLKWADVVVTDWDFPEGGFPALKPILLREKKPYIIQSSEDRHDSGSFLLGIVNKSNLGRGLIPLLQRVR